MTNVDSVVQSVLRADLFSLLNVSPPLQRKAERVGQCDPHGAGPDLLPV